MELKIMKYQSKRIKKLILSVGLCACIAVGSAADARAGNISQTVAKYDSGVQQALPALKEFYMRANDFQRDVYFDDLLLDPKKEMGLTQDNKDTPLLHKYSDREINARILALGLISNYSKALLQLSDPSKAKTAESDLRSIGNRIGEISRRLGVIAKAAPLVGAYATTAGEFAGLANKYWTRMKQEAALRETIREGAPRIANLLSLLEADASVFSEGIYKNAAQRKLNKYMSYYNEQFAQQPGDGAGSMTANRMEFLRRAQASAERYNTVSELNPSAALARMRKVNQDLLDWATAPKKQPFDINQLADDIDSYLDDVDTITNAASRIQSTR
ncbi:MAG: hypothetical protein AB7W16_01835 [Candidatus Obscuribacterales bacterium]